jgi:predicted CopG family antitoxin
MQKKLTISIDEQVYHGLHQVIGTGKISKFIEKLVKPHVLVQDLEAAYKEMSEDKEREDEATEWAEALIGDLDR